MTARMSRPARRRCRGRRPRPGEDRGSIAILMMVVLVGVMLAAVLVPMIISQNRTTRFDKTRVQSLDAAQAGIDVGLGLIRAAVSVDLSIPPVSYGDPAKLPCGPWPLTGNVNSTGLAAYSVKIEYFTTDPVTQPDSPANAMTCAPGYGTYKDGVVTPSYARITSTGTVGAAVNGSSAGRTLVTTYVFQTTNTNIAGGVVQIYSAATTSMCMDVGSATAAAGTAVVLQTCSTSKPPAPQQVFAYRTDLTLQLLSSVTPPNTNGLCLNSSDSPAVSGSTVRLAQCAPLGTPSPYTEQWSYNDYGAYQAAQASSQTDGVLPNLCMNASSQNANTAVTLTACNNVNATDTSQAWIPAPPVGAGAAASAPATGGRQWVNYYEFGRCLDVTKKSVTADHLIDYPCKQNPYAGAVAWNQKFATSVVPTDPLSGKSLIYTTTDGSNYCLTSPATIGGNVTIKVCGTTGAQQSWTINSGKTAVPYSTKFTIVDGSATGLCLGLGTPPVGADPWSYIDVETCDGSLDQKWNADPNVLDPNLQNTREK